MFTSVVYWGLRIGLRGFVYKNISLCLGKLVIIYNCIVGSKYIVVEYKKMIFHILHLFYLIVKLIRLDILFGTPIVSICMHSPIIFRCFLRFFGFGGNESSDKNSWKLLTQSKSHLPMNVLINSYFLYLPFPNLLDITCHFSCENRDGEIEAAEFGARQDLEAVRHRQGRIFGRRWIRAGNAPNSRQDRRSRPSFGATLASGASIEAQLRGEAPVPVFSL